LEPFIVANPFDAIRSRIARGKKHAADFHIETKDFMAQDVGEPIVETSADGKTELNKFRLIEPLPDALGDMAFDAVNNLRAALDQTGYAVALLAGKIEPKACKFPFGPTLTDVENNVRGGCKDLPTEISTLFASFQSYKGGNDSLWALNELANTNKHKLLVPVAMAAEQMTVDWHKASSKPVFFDPEWDRVKNEITFAKITAGEKFDYNLHITVFVAFDHAEIPKTLPAATLMSLMAEQVDAVIEATEFECKALHLL